MQSGQQPAGVIFGRRFEMDTGDHLLNQQVPRFEQDIGYANDIRRTQMTQHFRFDIESSIGCEVVLGNQHCAVRKIETIYLTNHAAIRFRNVGRDGSYGFTDQRRKVVWFVEVVR